MARVKTNLQAHKECLFAPGQVVYGCFSPLSAGVQINLGHNCTLVCTLGSKGAKAKAQVLAIPYRKSCACRTIYGGYFSFSRIQPIFELSLGLVETQSETETETETKTESEIFKR